MLSWETQLRAALRPVAGVVVSSYDATSATMWCRGQQLRCYHVVPGALAWWSSHLIFNRCCLLEAAANDGDDAGLAWLANAEAVAPLTGVFSE